MASSGSAFFDTSSHPSLQTRTDDSEETLASRPEVFSSVSSLKSATLSASPLPDSSKVKHVPLTEGEQQEYERLRDPFCNRSEHTTILDWMQMIFPGTLFFAPRVVAMMTIMTVTAVTAKIAMLGAPAFKKHAPAAGREGAEGEKNEAACKTPSGSPRTVEELNLAPDIPLTGWRRYLARLLGFYARMMLFVIGFTRINVVRRTYEELGLPTRPPLTGGQDGSGASATDNDAEADTPLFDPRASVIVSNHTGPWEGLALNYLCGCSFVSRHENNAIPWLGLMLRCVQAIAVSRNSDRSRAETCARILERATAPPGTWPPLCIFPEGTSINNKSVLEFRNGAFRAGVPVQPVCIRLSQTIGTDPSWSSNSSPLILLFKMLTHLYTPMEITVLPLYVPSEEEKRDANLYAENVRKVVAAAGGLPLSKFGVKDYFIMTSAVAAGMTQPEALLYIDELRKTPRTELKQKVREILQERWGKYSKEG